MGVASQRRAGSRKRNLCQEQVLASMGGSFGSEAVADASIASRRDEINRLILLASEPSAAAERIKAPLLLIVARDDADESGLRLPRISGWFDNP